MLDPQTEAELMRRVMEKLGPLAKDKTLRDWFSGMALQALLSPFAGCKFPDAETLAKDAYELADAMLKERERV